jgi:hypothetical protein
MTQDLRSTALNPKGCTGGFRRPLSYLGPMRIRRPCLPCATSSPLS